VKCGDVDIHRRYFAKGADTNGVSPKRKAISTEWVNRKDAYYQPALKECIVHVCRCCGYQWDSAPLPETPHRRMEITLPNGTVASITGDPDMSPETMHALTEMMRIISEQAAAGTLHLPENAIDDESPPREKP
jgi:hypothetical protein